MSMEKKERKKKICERKIYENERRKRKREK
jgi:hypothetical protein